MKFSEFSGKIKEVYAKRFPKSLCVCNIHNSLGGFISIDCFLAADKSEFPHFISLNDAISVKLDIDLPERKSSWNTESELPDTLVIKALKKEIKHKPSPEMSYLYCEYTRVNFRKTEGNADKIIKTFEKFVDRLYAEISKQYNAGNLLEYDESLFREKYDGGKNGKDNLCIA